jgi:hypothetical protein
MESKSKMIGFCLTAAEYADAQETFWAYGYRSIAFYARYATVALYAASRSDAREAQIRELPERLDIMAAQLVRHSSQVRNRNASQAAAGGVMSSAMIAASSVGEALSGAERSGGFSSQE